MRSFITIFILSMFSAGCNKDGGAITSPPAPSGINVSYWLTDTFGNPKAAFQSGESFVVHYSIANQTGMNLLCYFKAPLDFISVFSGDSVVASSRWGETMPASLWIQRTFPKDSIISNSWTGPNDPWRTPEISLPPGKYNYAVFVGIDFVDSVQIVTQPFSTEFKVE